MTGDDFRSVALSMQGAVERSHMGHPDFRANGKIFASLLANERTGSVRLTPDEQRAFMRTAPGAFTPAAGAWGRQGWTAIHLNAVDSATARAALLLAWEGIVQRPQTRTIAKKARPRAASGASAKRHATQSRKARGTSGARKRSG